VPMANVLNTRSLWFDICLTKEEAMITDKKLTIHVGPSQDTQRVLCKNKGVTWVVEQWPKELLSQARRIKRQVMCPYRRLFGHLMTCHRLIVCSLNRWVGLIRELFDSTWSTTAIKTKTRTRTRRREANKRVTLDKH
jgi:hypothetical protein